MRHPRLIAVLAAGMLLLPQLGSPAAAQTTKLYPSGKLDFAYGSQVMSAGGPATAHKPESKLFYTGDGRWWAALGVSSQSPAGVHLFELVDHNWVSRYVIPGSDPWEKADTLLQGNRLLVSLRDQDASPRSELYELEYGGSGQWSLISGPTLITAGAPETVTIARDSAGRVWSTWEESNRIRVRYAPSAGAAFTDLALPASVGNVNFDDISAVTAFGTSSTGFKIGIVWSDQEAHRFNFAWRPDSDPLATSSWRVETAYGGGVGGCPTATAGLCADDHVNVKVNGDEIYVAVKTSLNDIAGANAADPLIALLRRSPGGSWGSHLVSPVRQDASRPMVLLAPALNEIYVFAQRAFSTVQLWRSSYSSPSFNPDAATPWAASSGGAMNDPSSTKQLVTSSSGVVVETGVDAQGQYWHNELQASAPPPPPSPTPSPTPTPTPTQTSAPSTLRFTPSADAWVVADQPSTNFGSTANLKVDGSPVQQTFMRFDVSGTGGRTITNATLRVHVDNPSSRGGDFHRVTGSWTEGGITYGNRPAFDDAIVASLGAVETGQSYTVDVTSLVHGDGAVNLAATSTSGDGVDYVSREGSASMRPELVVTLGGTAPTPEPTQTAPPVTFTFTPSQDATLDSQRPSTNLGSATRVEVDQSPQKRFVMSFDVAGLAGRRVLSARLQLHALDGSPSGGSIHRVTSAWSESAVTWNGMPSFQATPVASFGSVAVGNWYELDVTPLVSGDGRVSLMGTSTANNGADYSSREGTASLRPRLIVTVAQ